MALLSPSSSHVHFQFPLASKNFLIASLYQSPLLHGFCRAGSPPRLMQPSGMKPFVPPTATFRMKWNYEAGPNRIQLKENLTGIALIDLINRIISQAISQPVSQQVSH